MAREETPAPGSEGGQPPSECESGNLGDVFPERDMIHTRMTLKFPGIFFFFNLIRRLQLERLDFNTSQGPLSFIPVEFSRFGLGVGIVGWEIWGPGFFSVSLTPL